MIIAKATRQKNKEEELNAWCVVYVEAAARAMHHLDCKSDR